MGVALRKMAMDTYSPHSMNESDQVWVDWISLYSLLAFTDFNHRRICWLAKNDLVDRWELVVPTVFGPMEAIQIIRVV